MGIAMTRTIAAACVGLLGLVLVISAATGALLNAATHVAAPTDPGSSASTPAPGASSGTDTPQDDEPGPSGSTPRGSDIPAQLLPVYRQAAASCPGLDWSILAAIGKIESDHGRSPLPGVRSGGNAAADAMGPMQIIPSTWAEITARHRIPDRPHPSPYSPHDSIWAASFLLCDNHAGNPATLRAAIFSYNHATWYVDQVLAQAHRYYQAARSISAGCASFQSSFQRSGEGFSAQALVAVRFACSQLGKPYVWGGNGSPGFDCSGLTAAAYAAAGISIPRTAQTQYQAGPLLRGGTTVQPGDLIFFGVPGNVHHVAISLGGTAIVHAPDFGQPVQVGDYRVFKDVLAVSRPAGVAGGYPAGTATGNG